MHINDWAWTHINIIMDIARLLLRPGDTERVETLQKEEMSWQIIQTVTATSLIVIHSTPNRCLIKMKTAVMQPQLVSPKAPISSSQMRSVSLTVTHLSVILMSCHRAWGGGKWHPQRQTASPVRYALIKGDTDVYCFSTFGPLFCRNLFPLVPDRHTAGHSRRKRQDAGIKRKVTEWLVTVFKSCIYFLL